VITRREFVVGAAVAAAPRLGSRPAPQVEAIATLFHGQPDGQTTLVRFVVTGVDAPAARLRVLSTRGALIGTAGLVRRGDVLVGELWIPLASVVSVRSDLESPVTRGVHRTTHRLAPTPRWTVHWVTLAEPGALRARFDATPLLLRGAEAVMLTEAGVRLNPWSAAAGAHRDHLELLRIAAPAARLNASTGVPLSERALLPASEAHDPFVRRALALSGVAGIIDDRVAADPAALAFGDGRARMAGAVESWLSELGRTLEPSGGDAGRRSVTVVGTDAEFAVRAQRSVEEWNGLYAYPRIEVGRLGGLGGGGVGG
jgi:hypothetical protein